MRSCATNLAADRIHGGRHADRTPRDGLSCFAQERIGMATNSIRFVCTALLFSPELAGIAAARSDTGQNHELRTEPSDDPIVFQLRTGFLIVVDGKVGSLSGLKFILDTGTTHSVLDTKIADKLSLPRQNATVLNFDRQLKIGWSNVPELQIGSLRARNLRMMVAPLS